MRIDITESLWFFALSSKSNPFSPHNTLFSLLIIPIIWAAMTLIHWVHPGGPAWGKYYLKRKPTISSPHSMVSYKPIPGPRGLPLVGSMGLMASPLAHHGLAAAAERWSAKRLMALTLGRTRVIVTSHPDVAREILHGSAFSDRPMKDSARHLMFHRAIGFAPNGAYWRALRRIAAVHLFSPRQIKASEARRSEIAARMVGSFRWHRGCFCVRDALKRASLDNMMCSVFGGRGDSEELRRLVDEGYEVLGMFNWSDHLPWLADLDPQKIRFRCSELAPRVTRFVSRILSEHRVGARDRNRDFVDVLLSLEGEDKLSEDDMIAVLWEMIFRGTDTVAVLMEWILARLVLHPEAQSRIHRELDTVVGPSGTVTESDVAAMVHLPAAVKEALRLHPPGPLLSWARLAIADTLVDGRHVPAGTTAMVNMWAISRDPEVWPDPLEFKPERFVRREGEVGYYELSVMGSDLRLAPFGSGRRACPGKALGLATVSFWVASLLHAYEFEPSDGEPVDLTEVLKLSCEMAHPLCVKARPRHVET